VGLGGSYRSRRRNLLLCGVLLLHNCMELGVVNEMGISNLYANAKFVQSKEKR
jgi:hypothetical protein